MRLLGRIIPRPINRLLGAVDDQRLGFCFAEAGRAFDAEQQLRRLLDPLHGAADHAAINTVEEADEFLGDGAAVIDQQDQRMVRQTANFPRPPGFELAFLKLAPGRFALPRHLVKYRHANAGQTAEAPATPQPSAQKRTAHRSRSCARKETYDQEGGL